jgi:type IV pilus assembly protein PilA
MVARPTRGFTLIELMIVVAIVAVLAVLATVGYAKFVRSAHMAEASDILADIRKAEESFRAENGAYLNVSTDLDHLYPAPTPGKFATQWGGPCSGCIAGVQWSTLNILPNAPVYFGYAVIADPATVPTLTVNGVNVDLSAMTAPWYVAAARADLNGNGVFCSVYATSSSNQLMVDREGE